MHSVLEQRKQYISIGRTDLFYNSTELCGNFTPNVYNTNQKGGNVTLVLLVKFKSLFVISKTAELINLDITSLSLHVKI